MTDRLQIVTTRLLYAFMSIYGGVTCSSCQILAVFVWNVFTFAILVTLSQTKVNNVDTVFRKFCPSN